MRLVGIVDMIRADKPLKTALSPSSEYNVFAVNSIDVPPSICWKNTFMNLAGAFAELNCFQSIE